MEIRHYVRIVRRNHRGFGPEGSKAQRATQARYEFKTYRGNNSFGHFQMWPLTRRGRRCRENLSLCADREVEPPGFWTRRIQCSNAQHKQDLYIRHIREINHSGFQIEDSLYYINHDTTGKIYKTSLFERKDSTSKY